MMAPKSSKLDGKVSMAEKTRNSCSKNIHFYQSLALWLLFLYFVSVTPSLPMRSLRLAL